MIVALYIGDKVMTKYMDIKVEQPIEEIFEEIVESLKEKQTKE